MTTVQSPSGEHDVAARQPSGPAFDRHGRDATPGDRSGSVSGVESEPDVRGWWERLGLPGLFDVHVHFLPPRLQAKVYAQFDAAGPNLR